MTDDEIQGLIAFGREVAKRRLELGLTFKEFSEKTKTDDADAISAGYLGEILGITPAKTRLALPLCGVARFCYFRHPLRQSENSSK